MAVREIVIEVISPHSTRRIAIYAEENNEIQIAKKILRKAGVKNYTLIHPYQGFFDVVGVEVEEEDVEAISSSLEEIKTWGE